MSLRTALIGLCAWLACAGAAAAHAMPNSTVTLDFGARTVRADLVLPWLELKHALPPALAEPPARLSTADRAWLVDYLVQHVGAAGPGGEVWTVQVQRLDVHRSPDHSDLEARLLLAPPPGVTARTFRLRYDVVTHIVKSHVVLAFVRNDYTSGRLHEDPQLFGALQAPADSLVVEAGTAGRASAFASAFKLGMRHIAEGVDHLLFLVTLLLPAAMAVRGGQWAGPVGARRTVIRLAATVTAFTIGHSLTLLVGAGLGLRLPERPVEVAIGLSIVVAAACAWRPAPFEGRAAPLIAGVFGLIHGMAFSGVIADYLAGAGARAAAIAGFNLGIEAVQLVIVLGLAPVLILLARAPAYLWILRVGAAAAGLAGLGFLYSAIN